MGVSVLALDLIKRVLLFVMTTILVICFAQAEENGETNQQQELAETIEYIDKTEQVVANEAAIEKEIAKNKLVNKKPVNRQLERDLQRQYQQLQKALESEDAFSASLAESYFSYASLLKQAQRYEEAIEAYTTALHIEKVNHGIYSLRQRSALKAMFDIHIDTGELEEAENQLQRILWVEEHNPDFIDNLTFSSLLKLGNYYIDLFNKSPRRNDRVMTYLQSANELFVIAEEKYGKLPITELLMPYGEIALVNYYLGKDAERSARDSNALRSSFSRGGSYYGSKETAELNYFMSQSFRQAENYLQAYITKAHDEKQQEQMVYAIINFADLQLLFKKRHAATEYYQSAWEQAQKLKENNPLRISLNKPVRLPAFNYAVKRQTLNKDVPFIEVPVAFDVSNTGLAKNISVKVVENISDEQKSSYKRAIRLIRGSVFRPAIIDGKVVMTEQFSQDVKIFIKNKS